VLGGVLLQLLCWHILDCNLWCCVVAVVHVHACLFCNCHFVGVVVVVVVKVVGKEDAVAV
jgi:hypothetical protein